MAEPAEETPGEGPGPPNMIPPPPPRIAPPPPPPSVPPEQLVAPPSMRRPAEPLREQISAPEEPELVRMEMFLRMDSNKLARIRQLIESIERMSKEEKEELLDRVQKMRAVSRDRRQEFLDNFKDLDRSERRILVRAYYRSTPEERKKILKDLQAIESEKDREAYLIELDEKHPRRQLPPPTPIERRPEMRAPGEVRPTPPAR